MRILVVCTFAICTVLADPVSAAELATNGEVGTALLNDLLDPVRTRLPPADQTSLALRNLEPSPATAGSSPIEDAIAGYFFDRGFDVWVLEPEAAAAEGSLLLEFELQRARFTYPRIQTSWLGLGPEKLTRAAEAALDVRLMEADTGHVLWRGTPEARYEDWVPRKEQQRLAADHPAWAEEGGPPADGSGSPWKERVAVLGLLGGVILLYFSGAN